MIAKLALVRGTAQATEFTIELPTVIGRSREVDLRLADPLISRRHCELFSADGYVVARDLGSLNGTFVGQFKIDRDTVVSPGEVLSIGPLAFRVLYSRPTPRGEVGAASSGPRDLPSAEPENVRDTTPLGSETIHVARVEEGYLDDEDLPMLEEEDSVPLSEDERSDLEWFRDTSPSEKEGDRADDGPQERREETTDPPSD